MSTNIAKEPPSALRQTFNNLLSGTTAGISVVLVGFPFDTLKVRLQTQPVHNPIYKGLADCFIKTLKWEGIGGLYKGVGEYCTDDYTVSASMYFDV